MFIKEHSIQCLVLENFHDNQISLTSSEKYFKVVTDKRLKHFQFQKNKNLCAKGGSSLMELHDSGILRYKEPPPSSKPFMPHIFVSPIHRRSSSDILGGRCFRFHREIQQFDNFLVACNHVSITIRDVANPSDQRKECKKIKLWYKGVLGGYHCDRLSYLCLKSQCLIVNINRRETFAKESLDSRIEKVYFILRQTAGYVSRNGNIKRGRNSAQRTSKPLPCSILFKSRRGSVTD
ncbi:hypothetical protein X798_01059 [Onchocerca flexuosa]|uniref:Uncharacterized protein n=1 Tax=Onchocerca flexuosa TaxID=387005 RepID=A0A238C4P2_9BILA|nr:hypothetical protein X798_01059 [Onchocerca flexuosa]